MNKLIFGIAILFGCVGSAWGAAPGAPLPTIESISALSNVQANQGLPVAVEATVTLCPGYDGLLFVQNGTHAIFVYDNLPLKLHLGDRILIRGRTQGSFHPIILADSITLLHPGKLPSPIRQLLKIWFMRATTAPWSRFMPSFAPPSWVGARVRELLICRC